jgi:hypothetical protein
MIEVMAAYLIFGTVSAAAAVGGYALGVWLRDQR